MREMAGLPRPGDYFDWSRINRKRDPKGRGIYPDPAAVRARMAGIEAAPVPPSPPEIMEEFEGIKRFNLTLTKVPRRQRDKFRALIRRDTYNEIRKGGVGDRVAYSVDLTYPEYRKALSDAADPRVNLINIEPDFDTELYAVPGAEVMAYHRASQADSSGMTGAGVKVGMVDTGISPAVQAILGSRLKARVGFDGASAAGDYAGHGSWMVGLCGTGQTHVYSAATAQAVSSRVRGIYWCIEQGVHIMSNSYGAAITSTVLEDAVNAALDAGIIFFAAAGNNGINEPTVPASYPGVKCLTNYVPSTDSKNPSSSYGPHVWAAAAGSEINVYGVGGGEFFSYDMGTSGATALAAGLCARLMSSGLSGAEAASLLAQTARKTGAGSLFEGNGVLRLQAALEGGDPTGGEGPGEGGDPGQPGGGSGGGGGGGRPPGGGGLTQDPQLVDMDIAVAYLDPCGQLWGWGWLGAGAFEEPPGTVDENGDPLPHEVYYPVKLKSGNGVASVGAGIEGYHFIRLDHDGSVWHTGMSSTFFGGSFAGDRSEPYEVAGMAGARRVFAGDRSSWAIMPTGEALVYGDNSLGSLGAEIADFDLAVTVDDDVPIRAPKLDGATDIFHASSNVAGFGVAIVDKQIRYWGQSAWQIFEGDGNSYSGSSNELKAQVKDYSGASDVKRCQCDYFQGFAAYLKTDGTLWVIGYIPFPMFGQGSAGWQPSTQIMSEVAEFAMGHESVIARKSDGTLWGFGWGALSEVSGQLGPGLGGENVHPDYPDYLHTPTQLNIPVPATGPISSTYEISRWVGQDCKIRSSGIGFARYGDGLTYDTFVPEPDWIVAGKSSEETDDFSGNSVSAGYQHSLATKEGKVYGWGRNERFALAGAVDVNTDSLTAVEIPGISSVSKVCAGKKRSAAIGSDGSVWVWGSRGGLGNHEVPTQVTGISSATQIVAGYDSALSDDTTFLILKSDGTVWTISPSGEASTQVAGLSGVTKVGAGNAHFIALSGTDVYAWGNNSAYQLGDGTDVDSPTPILVATNCEDVAAGREYSAVIKTTGEVWTTGSGTSGTMGDGSTTNNMGFEAVPNLSGVDEMYGGQRSIIVKTGTTFKGWGENSGGQLGDGSTSDQFTPVNLSSLSDATMIALGADHGLMVKSDSSVWAWGLNPRGQIGDNTTTMRTSPVRVQVNARFEYEWIFDACPDCGDGDGGGGPGDNWIPPGEVPPLPPPLTEPPLTPPPGDYNFEPDELPNFEIEIPGDIDFPDIGDNIDDFPEFDDIDFPDFDGDPCNWDMPGGDGGLCGPGDGGDPGGGTGGGNGGGNGTGGGNGIPNPRPNPTPQGKFFLKKTCFKNELCTSIIRKLCLLVKADPEKIIIQPSTERYTGCFKKGSNIFDALRLMARICGFGIIIGDDGTVTIEPPKPTNVHHYLHEATNIFALVRVYDNTDLYEYVEVTRPPLYRNGYRVKPGVSKVAAVRSPFQPPAGSKKPIEIADYNLTDRQIQNLANYEANKISGGGAKCQVTTLLNRDMKLYDRLHIQRPSINWYTQWMIRSITHSYTNEGFLTIVQATWLQADPVPSVSGMRVASATRDVARSHIQRIPREGFFSNPGFVEVP